MAKRWTTKEKEYVFSVLGTKSISEIAKDIGKTEMSLSLFLHRNRRDPRTVVKNNILLKILIVKFTYPEYFNPTRHFFNSVKIGQKRYWAIYKGIERITDEEYKRVIDHFQIPYQEVYEIRQLSLFDNE